MRIAFDPELDRLYGTPVRRLFLGGRPGSPAGAARIGSVIPAAYVLVLQHHTLESALREDEGIVFLGVAVVDAVAVSIIDIVGCEWDELKHGVFCHITRVSGRKPGAESIHIDAHLRKDSVYTGIRLLTLYLPLTLRLSSLSLLILPLLLRLSLALRLRASRVLRGRGIPGGSRGFAALRRGTALYLHRPHPADDIRLRKSGKSRCLRKSKNRGKDSRLLEPYHILYDLLISFLNIYPF